MKPAFTRCLAMQAALVLFCLFSAVPASTDAAVESRSLPAISGPRNGDHDTCQGYCAAPAALAEPKQNAQSELEKQALAFARDNGIDCEHEKGKFVFKLKVGKEITLFATDASADGLKSAKTQLAGLVSDKMSQLTKTFAVTFSAADEVVDKQWVKNDKDEWVRGNDVKARLPRLNELYGIEAALYKAQPSHKAKNSSTQSIKFYFLTDDLTKGERPLASYSSSRNGGPSIQFYPGSTSGRPVLESDAPFDPTRAMGHAYGSIEALTLHEISHNHQHVMDWWTVVESTAADELGYVAIGDSWAFKAKAKDKAGRNCLYRRNDKSYKWYRCDDKGNAIAGEPELTGVEMRQQALHQPMTYYFPSPGEIYAEGLMIFRLGGQYRASLLKENPALYAVAKRLDQKEMNLIYGVEYYSEWEQGQDQWGRTVWYQVTRERSKYLRGTEGRPVKNTDDNRRAISEFEQKTKDDAARQKLSIRGAAGK